MEVEPAEVCSACGAPLTEETVAPVEEAPAVEVPTVDPGAQKGNIAMILGIVALALGALCSCLAACLGGALPFILAIVGIVMGTMAMKASKEAGFDNKKAKIGLILSIAAIVVIVIFIILNAILGGIIGASMAQSSYGSYYY
jgi:hypothetical protein